MCGPSFQRMAKYQQQHWQNESEKNRINWNVMQLGMGNVERQWVLSAQASSSTGAAQQVRQIEFDTNECEKVEWSIRIELSVYLNCM